MPEVYKMFQHNGPRNQATDSIAERLAECAVRDTWPDAADISFVWTHHNQPDIWLLFATGVTPE